MKKWKVKAKKMVDELYHEGYIFDPIVSEALTTIPLHAFLPQRTRKLAYEDDPLLFAKGTLGPRPTAAPHMIAIMLQLLNLDTENNVLQLGSMSGYFASLMSEIAYEGEVFCVEADQKIADITQRNLAKTGYDKKITVIRGDPLEGLQEEGPWDRIVLCGAVPEIPLSLPRQLCIESVLLAPVGELENQELIRLLKTGRKKKTESFGQVSFIPLGSKLLTEIKAIEYVRAERMIVQKSVENFFKEEYPIQEPIFRSGIPPPIMKDLQDAYALCEDGYYKAAVAMACVSVEGALRCLYERTVREKADIDKWTLPNFAEKLYSIHVLSDYSKKTLELLNELRKYSVHYKPEPIPGIDQQARAAVNHAKWFVECAFKYQRASI